MFTCLQGIFPQYRLIGTANWMVSNPKIMYYIQNWTGNNESPEFIILMKNICNKSHINLLFWSPVKLFSSPAVALQNLSSPSACQEKAESYALVVTKLCFPIVFNIECKLRCHYFPTFWWRAVWLFAIVWLWWMIQLHIGLITKCKQSAKLNLQIEWQCLLDKY